MRPHHSRQKAAGPGEVDKKKTGCHKNISCSWLIGCRSCGMILILMKEKKFLMADGLDFIFLWMAARPLIEKFRKINFYMDA